MTDQLAVGDIVYTRTGGVRCVVEGVSHADNWVHVHPCRKDGAKHLGWRGWSGAITRQDGTAEYVRSDPPRRLGDELGPLE